MRDMMEMGNRRRVVCRVHRENQAALAFFQAMGFVPLEGEPPEEPEKLWLAYTLRPWAPGAEKPPSPIWWKPRTMRRPGSGLQSRWM